MRMIDSKATNSQQGPTQGDSNYSAAITKFLYKPHSRMFIEDFCNNYSIALSKHINERNFFKVDNNEKLFKSIFGYDFLEYDLDKLLSNITKNLILFGKAYVERIYTYDDKDILTGIYYKCINCKRIKRRANHIVYKLKTEDKQKLKGRIYEQKIIAFSIRDLGFSKKFFFRRIKKLKHIELPKTELALAKYFDMNQFIKKSDYKLLKIMKNVHWNARKYDNAYVTEPYLLYNQMMFAKLKTRFLEYLIKKINEDIDSIKLETKFTGKITFDSIAQNYDNEIKELESGEKNCEQISNMICKIY